METGGIQEALEDGEITAVEYVKEFNAILTTAVLWLSCCTYGLPEVPEE